MLKIRLMSASVVTLLLILPVQAQVCGSNTECVVISSVTATHYCDLSGNTNVTSADYFWRSPSGTTRYLGSATLNCNGGDVPSTCKNKSPPKVCNGIKGYYIPGN